MRLFIIASDPLARAGLAALLSTQSSLQVVGQAAPTDDLAALMAVFRPNAILWDVGWNLSPSLDLLASFSESAPPIVALIGSDTMAAPLWASGVHGVLNRSLSAEQICAALIASSYGLRVSDGALLGSHLRADSARNEAGLEPLTERELEVLRRMAEGLPNKTIARELMISEHTVKFHVNAILGKMQAQSRTEAVVRATRAGLILL